MNRIQIILLSLLLLSCNMGAKDNKAEPEKLINCDGLNLHKLGGLGY